MNRRRSGAIALFAVTAACSAPSSPVTTVAQIVPGTYAGRDSAGGLIWSIQQSGADVSGTGSFQATGSTTAAPYSLRGTFVNGELILRLVGAPGDADADSVWFDGRAASDLYAGAAFTGSLHGPTAALFGELSMYLASGH